MILGIGTDLANIDRIAAVLERHGDRFRTRVFTETEQAKAEGRPLAVAATYAKRWAAKEACSKALGTGLRMGISWRDMAVSNLETGQPVMRLTGWAATRLAEMTPPGEVVAAATAPVLLINPLSGDGKAARLELQQRAEERGIRPSRGVAGIHQR